MIKSVEKENCERGNLKKQRAYESDVFFARGSVEELEIDDLELLQFLD